MPATKISADPAASTLTGAETIPLLQGGANKRTTLAALPVSDAVQDALDEKLDADARGAVNGVASLGSDGKVPADQLPAGSEGTVTAAGITDASAAGRTLLTAANSNAQKTALSLVKADVGLANVENTSDANKPVSTAQAAAIGAKLDASARGAANGVASLDSSSKILESQLPSIAITDVSVVASQAAMLALTAERGDIAVRTDLNKTFALSTNSPSTLADWIELRTPTDSVVSVAGKTGAVSLAKADVGLGSVDNTADTAKPVSTAQQTALDAKETIGAYTAGINTQTGTAYTLVLADKGKLVEMNNAAANTLTVPLNSAVAFPIGSRIDIEQYGAGQTTIAATGGVTIRSASGKLKLTGQYSGATLIKRATDEWVLVGDIAA